MSTSRVPKMVKVEQCSTIGVMKATSKTEG